MAKIVDYQNIPLNDLVIGKGQVRTENPGKDIDDLVTNIEVQGLLQPIVVCPAKDPGKWEILTGQRRFLAHKILKRKTISAAVMDERVDEAQAKAISVAENLVRRQLTGKELKDGILFLYNIYGSVPDVARTTGLSENKVRDYVKYPRLVPELKALVNEHAVDVNVAVRAQDSSMDQDGNVNTEVAVRLAGEMVPMTDVQRKKVVKEIRKDPGRSVDDVIKWAKAGGKVTRINATVTQDTHAALRRFATEEGANQDEAAAMLIEEALTHRGFLEE